MRGVRRTESLGGSPLRGQIESHRAPADDNRTTRNLPRVPVALRMASVNGMAVDFRHPHNSLFTIHRARDCRLLAADRLLKPDLPEHEGVLEGRLAQMVVAA